MTRVARKPLSNPASPMQFRSLTLERHDATATVTLERPDKLNSLSRELLRELTQVFSSLDADLSSDVHAVVLTGSGDRAFAAGADVEQMSGMTVDEAREYSTLGHELGHTMEDCRLPIIAAVRGFALGGGCELALCADFIIASENAVFGMPEVKLGLMPGFGGTFRLADRVGVAKARQLIYQGTKLKAREALALGLVNEVVPKDQLSTRAQEIADDIASSAPLGVQAAKHAILVGRRSDPRTASRHETQAFAGLFDSDDAQAGLAAVLAKRTNTRFKGR